MWNYQRCAQCSCRVLSPRVPESDIGEFYGEHYPPYIGGHSRQDRPLVGNPHGDELERHLDKLYRVVPAGSRRVLDFGAGSGAFCRAVAARGWAAVAADFSENGLRHTRALGFEGHVVDEAFWRWLQPESFEVIRLSHVIEHLYRPQVDLQRLVQSLAPGGTLHIITPDPNGPSSTLLRRHSIHFQVVHTVLIPPQALERAVASIGCGQPVVIQQTSAKDLWRSFKLATGSVRTYEGTPEASSHRTVRAALKVLMAVSMKLGRSDGYHAFISAP